MRRFGHLNPQAYRGLSVAMDRTSGLEPAGSARVSDQAHTGSLSVMLQPGFMVCQTSASCLDAVDRAKSYPGDSEFIHHPRLCRTSFARRQFAPQTTRRAPCGQRAKSTIDTFNKQNKTPVPDSPQNVDARFVRKLSAVNTAARLVARVVAG